ncbi:MAG TPA: alpha/beta hydrolase, partial [Chthoniobacterales bacterium]|nr:alpha/beta hydrolase [Chthoniobacterales bacterium]
KFADANRAYFQSQGIDLSAYNTTESAQDYEDARVALGYGAINFFANSYGTFVTQEILRRNPAMLRSVVMSGNSPATDPFLPTTLEIEEHGVNALINDVSRSSRARRDFPNFRGHFYKLMASLHAKPVKLKLKNTDTGKLEPVVIDDQEFLSTLTELLQSTRTIYYIPLLVRQFEQKNYHSLVARFFAPQKDLRLDNPFGQYLSVLATDFAAPGYVRATERGILKTRNPSLIKADGSQILQLSQLVVTWGLPYNPGTTRTLPQSSVRTLFLNGEMDAQTPVSGGATIAAGVPNSVNYVYPRIGHGVGFDIGPDLTAAVSFINDPTQAPAYSVGTLLRRGFYKTRAPSFKTRGVDDWRSYLTDLPLSRALPRDLSDGDEE